jgi:hypothetical protein
MTEKDFILSDLETEETLTGDEKRAMKTARDFLGGMVPSQGQRISITRTRPAWIPGGGGWLETVDFSPEGCEFSLEGLREQYGGGTYVLKVLNEKGKFLAAQTIKIAGDPIHQGRRLTQQMVEQSLQPVPPPPATKDNDMAELVKALLANSSKEQQKSFDLLVSLWNKQDRPAGQPTSFKEMADMIKFVDDIRGGSAPAEDNTMMGMMGLLSQFMTSKQQAPAPATAPPAMAYQQQTRQPMRFSAPPMAKPFPASPLMPQASPLMPQASPLMPQASPVPQAMPQASPVPQAMPQASPVPQAMPQASPVPPLDDLEFHGDESEEVDIADDIADWPVEDIVQLIADVMGKLPEAKTLQLMERMKTT